MAGQIPEGIKLGVSTMDRAVVERMKNRAGKALDALREVVCSVSAFARNLACGGVFAHSTTPPPLVRKASVGPISADCRLSFLYRLCFAVAHVVDDRTPDRLMFSPSPSPHLILFSGVFILFRQDAKEAAFSRKRLPLCGVSSPCNADVI